MKSKSCAVYAVLVAALSLLMAVPSRAHHSLFSEFDHNKTVSLKGVISSVEWVNPHIYIYLDVAQAGGGVTTWAIETFPPNHMRTRFGLSKAVLVGDSGHQTLTIDVNPAANGKTLGWLKAVTFPDGHVVRLAVDPGDPEAK